MNKEAKITGGCLCGEIRYESDKPPYLAGYCHCNMCKKAVGNMFSTASFFKHAHFRYIKGKPKWFTSQGAKRGFCSTCGSPIAFQREGFEQEYCAVWLGTLDNPENIEPEAEWHVESRLPWVDMGPELHDLTPQDATSRYDIVK